MKMRKRGRSASGEEVRLVAGVAWFRREDYPRLLEISSDRENLEEGYDDWLRSAEKVLRTFRKKGGEARKVEVDLDELIFWCDRQNVKIDGGSRSEFAAWKLRQLKGGPS